MISIYSSELLMRDSQLANTKQQFIYAEQSYVNVNNTKFINGGDNTRLGGAIYCECQGMHLEDNFFLENDAASGGALYLIGIPNSGPTNHYNTKTANTFIITDTTFELNKA